MLIIMGFVVTTMTSLKTQINKQQSYSLLIQKMLTLMKDFNLKKKSHFNNLMKTVTCMTSFLIFRKQTELYNQIKLKTL